MVDLGDRSGIGLVGMYSPSDVRKIFGEQFSQREGHLRSIVKSHHEAKFLEPAIECGARIVYMYRNPVDVFISFWKFLSRFPEEGGRYSSPLELAKGAPVGSALRYQVRTHLSYFERWFWHVNDWLALAKSRKNIVCVSYEELNGNFDQCMQRILAEIDIEGVTDPIRPHRDLYIKGAEIEVAEFERDALRDYIVRRLEELGTQGDRFIGFPSFFD